MGAGRNPAALGLLFTWTRGTTTTNDTHLIKGVFFNTYSCSMSSFCVTEPYYIDTVPYIAKYMYTTTVIERYKYIYGDNVLYMHPKMKRYEYLGTLAGKRRTQLVFPLSLFLRNREK